MCLFICIQDERMVVNEDDIHVNLYTNAKSQHKLWLKIYYTPTVAHCSLTSLIGLCIYQKLKNEFPITAHTLRDLGAQTHTLKKLSLHHLH